MRDAARISRDVARRGVLLRCACTALPLVIRLLCHCSADAASLMLCQSLLQVMLIAITLTPRLSLRHYRLIAYALIDDISPAIFAATMLPLRCLRWFDAAIFAAIAAADFRCRYLPRRRRYYATPPPILHRFSDFGRYHMRFSAPDFAFTPLPPPFHVTGHFSPLAAYVTPDADYLRRDAAGITV